MDRVENATTGRVRNVRPVGTVANVDDQLGAADVDGLEV